MNTSRHPHYLSQCYLKGFTQGNSKKSKLTVIDLKRKRKSEATPKSIGGMQSFNRVEMENIAPNLAAEMQSTFEGKAAAALKNLENTFDFSGETKDLLLELIGMLIIKSPEMSKLLIKPHMKVAGKAVAIALESEEHWKIQAEQIKTNNGADIGSGTSYEKIKAFVKNQEYEAKEQVQHAPLIELTGAIEIASSLHNRNWVLVKTADGAGEFITTDDPVCLTWHDPEKAPPFVLPGFKMKNTMVYFPVSKNLALVGEYDRKNDAKEANKKLVAALNSKIVAHGEQHIFASRGSFNYTTKEGEITTANALLRT